MSLIAPEGLLLGAIAGVLAIPLRSRPTAEHSISIDTRFGSIALAERQILDTPDGLPGFENSRRFVLIDLENSRFSPFLLLQGIDGGGRPSPSCRWTCAAGSTSPPTLRRRRTVLEFDRRIAVSW